MKIVKKKSGRRQLDAEPRQGIEVSLTASDIQYARDLTGGNLSAALTMLIREHRRRAIDGLIEMQTQARDTLAHLAREPAQFTHAGKKRLQSRDGLVKAVESRARAIERLNKKR